MSKLFVSLDAAKQVICDACARPGCPRLWGHNCDRIDRLFENSAADVVEIVRCKDCAYYNHTAGFCDHFGIDIADIAINNYCSDGYRRDNNG